VHASAAICVGIVPRVQNLQRLAALLLVAFGLVLWAEEADARLFRDARVAEVARAIGLTDPALAAQQPEISPCAAQPAYPAGSLGGLFSRPGLIGGFAAGFLGAGIFGLLFGHGMIGELSGVPSILGVIFQFALLLAFGWLVRAWWRADRAAGLAQLSPRQLADAYGRDRNDGLPDVGTDRKSEAAEREEIFATKQHSGL
jgi:predicted lipid-binding transport protein (Tim44 family)